MALERSCNGVSETLKKKRKLNIPPINFVQDRVGSSFPMFVFKVFARPLDKVVLEYALDDLVENIWGYHLVDVCAREVICKWLARRVRKTGM